MKAKKPVIDEKYKGKLFLTSNGYRDKEENQNFNNLLKACTGMGVNALFVNNSTLTGHNQMNTPLIMKFMQDNGAVVQEVTLTTGNLDMIKNFDVVYFAGGDIAPLFELANNSNLEQVMLSYLQNGGVVFGESAGAIVFTESCENVWKLKRMLADNKGKYADDLPSFKGLGFVDLNFYPHWNYLTQEQKAKAEQYAEVYKIKITALNDGQWLEYGIKDILMQIVRRKMHRR